MAFEGELQGPARNHEAVEGRHQGAVVQTVALALFDEALDVGELLRVDEVVGKEAADQLWHEVGGGDAEDGGGETQGVSDERDLFVVLEVVEKVLEVGDDVVERIAAEFGVEELVAEEDELEELVDTLGTDEVEGQFAELAAVVVLGVVDLAVVDLGLFGHGVLEGLGSVGPDADEVVGDLAVDVELEFGVVKVAFDGDCK